MISYGILSRRSARKKRQFHSFLTDEQASPSFHPCFICAAHHIASHWCVWFLSSGSDARRGCSRWYIHWQADPEPSSWPGWFPYELRPQCRWPEGDLLSQKSKGLHQTVVIGGRFFEPFICNRPSADDTHALRQLERKQSRWPTGSDPGTFWGLFYVLLVSQHKPNLHTKSLHCCYHHCGDSAWRWRSMCRGTPEGSPAEVKVQKHLRSSGIA